MRLENEGNINSASSICILCDHYSTSIAYWVRVQKVQGTQYEYCTGAVGVYLQSLLHVRVRVVGDSVHVRTCDSPLLYQYEYSIILSVVTPTRRYCTGSYSIIYRLHHTFRSLIPNLLSNEPACPGTSTVRLTVCILVPAQYLCGIYWVQVYPKY